MRWLDHTHVGDCRRLMRRMIADGIRVQCIVTSPPYWGLRDYGAPGQFGLERTWVRHVARMRGVMRLCRELLADDGVLWLNYGDSYAGAPGGMQGHGGQRSTRTHTARIKTRKGGNGLKPKDLVGVPWRMAFALQDDGWYLRQDIIWHKPNPMPESTRDRCTKAHEYLFLLSKSARYYWDFEAMQEPVGTNTHARGKGVNAKCVAGWASGDGRHSPIEHARAADGATKFARGSSRSRQNADFSAAISQDVATRRNRRSVWTIPAEPFSGAHFATFPTALVKPCILAGSRPGDTILDPFMGSGTVAQVALELGRHYIGCELNPAYAALFGSHRGAQVGLALDA